MDRGDEGAEQQDDKRGAKTEASAPFSPGRGGSEDPSARRVRLAAIEGQAEQQAAGGGEQVEQHVVPFAGAAGHEPLEPLVGHADGRRRQRRLDVGLPARRRAGRTERTAASARRTRRSETPPPRPRSALPDRSAANDTTASSHRRAPAMPIRRGPIRRGWRAGTTARTSDAPEHDRRGDDRDVVARKGAQQRQTQIADEGRAQHDRGGAPRRHRCSHLPVTSATGAAPRVELLEQLNLPGVIDVVAATPVMSRSRVTLLPGSRRPSARAGVAATAARRSRCMASSSRRSARQAASVRVDRALEEVRALERKRAARGAGEPPPHHVLPVRRVHQQLPHVVRARLPAATRRPRATRRAASRGGSPRATTPGCRRYRAGRGEDRAGSWLKAQGSCPSGSSLSPSALEP